MLEPGREDRDAEHGSVGLRIENDRVVVLPTEDRDFELMVGRAKQMTRLGPAAPGFEATSVLPDFTKKAIEVIDRRAADAKQGKPFFLYLPFASPHTPIQPTQEWLGKSGLNAYADFVMQQDTPQSNEVAVKIRNAARSRSFRAPSLSASNRLNNAFRRNDSTDSVRRRAVPRSPLAGSSASELRAMSASKLMAKTRQKWAFNMLAF